MPYFTGMSKEDAGTFRQGALDAYGLSPERLRSDGTAPCRWCLNLIEAGFDMLVLAYRPFEELQPYAETGPFFLYANDCEAVVSSPDLPEVIVSPRYLLKDYSSDERIVYGTGRVRPRQTLLLMPLHFLNGRVSDSRICGLQRIIAGGQNDTGLMPVEQFQGSSSLMSVCLCPSAIAVRTSDK